MYQLLPYSRSLFIFIFSYFSLSLYGQGGIFYHLTTANGLSSNRTTAVIQDREGFYWIATEDGLSRFDGTNCRVFRKINNDTTSLSNNHCTSLMLDRNGDIWASTYLGLNRYKSKEGKFQRYFFNYPGINPDIANFIWGVAEDKGENIWVAAGRLWMLDVKSRKWTVFLHRSADKTTIPDGRIYNIEYDKKRNGLWLLVKDRIAFYDLDQKKFFHNEHNPLHNTIFDRKAIGAFSVSGDYNRLWFVDESKINTLSYYDFTENGFWPTPVSGDKGIRKISNDNSGKTWVHYYVASTVIYDPTSQTADSSLLNNYHNQSALTNISAGIFIDKAGIYWISSTAGVSIYDPGGQAINKFFINSDQKTGEGGSLVITSLAGQKENTVWTGTNLGLFRVDLKTRQQKFISSPLYKNMVWKLYLHHNRVLWAGGLKEIVLIDTKTEKIIRVININHKTQIISPAGSGNVYVATWDNGIYHYSKEGNLLAHLLPLAGNNNSLVSKNIIYFSADTLNGYAWIGYNGGNGFSKYDYRTNRFLHFTVNTNESNYRAFNNINYISEDNDAVWLSTHGGGLIHFDTDTKNYSVYNQNDGLKSDFVHATVFDKKGNLWISTANGISIMDTAQKTIISAGIDLPELNNDVLHNAVSDNNGSFFFFKRNYIAAVNPPLYLDQNYPSKMLITSFSVFDKEIILKGNEQDTGTVRLSHRNNYFNIEYSLLKTNPNTSPQYAYKLEGFDKDWNLVKERRLASYTNVPPGNYTFRVKAVNQLNNKIYESKPVAITIVPPFWRTVWFYMLLAGTLGLCIWFLYRYRINQLKKMLAIRTKISQDLHDEVGATLSGVTLMSELVKEKLKFKKDTEGVHLYIDRIAGESKQMAEKMNDIVWAINPGNDSLEKVMNKIQAYGVSHCSAKNIRFHFAKPADKDEVPVNMQARNNIYLVSKEAINNAVKYSGAKNIYFTLAQRRSEYVLCIRDDGAGFEQAAIQTGNGLANMKARTQEMGAKLHIISEKGKGTSIELYFS